MKKKLFILIIFLVLVFVSVSWGLLHIGETMTPPKEVNPVTKELKPDISVFLKKGLRYVLNIRKHYNPKILLESMKQHDTICIRGEHVIDLEKEIEAINKQVNPIHLDSVMDYKTYMTLRKDKILHAIFVVSTYFGPQYFVMVEEGSYVAYVTLYYARKFDEMEFRRNIMLYLRESRQKKNQGSWYYSSW